jgi:hypothetical protein
LKSEAVVTFWPFHFVKGSGSLAFVVKVRDAGRAAHVAALVAVLVVVLEVKTEVKEPGLVLEDVEVDVTRVVGMVEEEAAVPTKHWE